MKKLLVFLLVLTFLSSPGLSFAQQATDDSPAPTPVLSPTTVDYTLPYPGILPGSPVYPVKVLRDRLVEFFISDPLKRAEFYLRQSDKHLSAGQILVMNNHENYDLAETTISKGEKYMELSLDQIPTIKALQLKETELLNRLVTALAKHDQVIKSLEKDAPGDVKTGLEKSRKHIAEMQKRADLLKLQSQEPN